jgi:hypothetical protein
MFSVPLPRKVSSLHTTYPIRLISNDTSITPSFLQSSGKTQDVPENHLPIQMWLCHYIDLGTGRISPFFRGWMQIQTIFVNCPIEFRKS